MPLHPKHGIYSRFERDESFPHPIPSLWHLQQYPFLLRRAWIGLKKQYRTDWRFMCNIELDQADGSAWQGPIGSRHSSHCTGR